jgi:hypothetical protein
MGRVLTLARNDARRIISQMGFETEITLVKDSLEVSVNGMGLVHHLTFDTDGLPVNSKSAHITVTEGDLNEVEFTCRNANGEVYMRDVLVSFADSTGTVKTYIVEENYADETLGIIFLNLGKYAQ